MVSLLPIAAAMGVALAYLLNAQALVRYPWDWAPDEGYYLDCARRLLYAPATVYGRSMVPYPCFYTPLIFALLTPVLGSGAPLFWGRLLALGWTTMIVAGVFVIVRRRGSLAMAAAAAALVLAPLDLSLWYLIVRMDGLMIALWMWSAVVLLPVEVARGADRLSGRRIGTGVVLMVLAVLAKQSALVHAAPLILVWFLVDRRSALRLTFAAGLGLAVTLLALDRATSGGFSYGLGWGRVNPWRLEYLAMNLNNFFSRAWPLLLLAAGGALSSWRSGGRPWRDSTVWLALSGLAMAPAMARYGSLWTYLLPFLCATAALVGRFWSASTRPAAAWGAILAAALAGGLTATREFLLPDPLTGRSAEVFYAFVRLSAEGHPGPILTTRPEYAYFVADQSVEVEGTSFALLAAQKAPGFDRVLARLRAGGYRLVIRDPYYFPAEGPFAEALAARYRSIGGCVLTMVDGPSWLTFMVPLESTLAFSPPANSRCWR
jgi:hypothetical protein